MKPIEEYTRERREPFYMGGVSIGGVFIERDWEQELIVLKEKMEAIVAISKVIENISRALLSTNVKVEVSNNIISTNGTGISINVEDSDLYEKFKRENTDTD